MRTSIDLNRELLRRVKRKAADEGVTIREIVERALRAHLDDPPSARRRYRLRWRTEKGRIAPGARLDDRGSLVDFMEGRS